MSACLAWSHVSNDINLGVRRKRMIRTILGLLAGMVLAFAGVFLFVWVLYWLWARLSAEKEAAPIEIEAQPPEPAAETPAVEAEAEEIELETKAPEPPVEPDDLKRIEGIGPKLSSVLQEAGIMTYAQLAAATPDELEQILEAADPRLLRLADPAAWSEQAALAATGEWEALDALKGTLKRGRRA
jgi:predicted flap endonuclease-1-like 5' DNA nuclease